MKKLLSWKKAAGFFGFVGAGLALLVYLAGLDPLWVAPAALSLVLAFRLPGDPLAGVGLAVAVAGGVVLAREGHQVLGALVGSMPFLAAVERNLAREVVRRA